VNQESRKTGKALRDSEITQQIIAAAIGVHRQLGPGFLESVYEEALAVEFALRGIQFLRQYPVPSFYRDHQIGEHRLDFPVERKIVIEFKAVTQLENIHFAIGRSYLKATNLQDRLLFNFATTPSYDQTLLPRAFERRCRSRSACMNFLSSCFPDS
jgi:GxxExxY protein